MRWRTLTPISLLLTTALGWRTLTAISPLVPRAQSPHVSALQGEFACPVSRPQALTQSPAAAGRGTLAVPPVPHAALPWVRLGRGAAPAYSPGLAEAGIHVPIDRDGDSQKTHPSPTIAAV